MAGRLLVDMARASAGSLSTTDEGLSARFRRPPGPVPPASDSGMQEDNNEGDDGDDEEESSEDDDSGSEGSRAPTEIASVCTVITTTGMDPAVATKVRLSYVISSSIWYLVVTG